MHMQDWHGFADPFLWFWRFGGVYAGRCCTFLVFFVSLFSSLVYFVLVYALSGRFSLFSWGGFLGLRFSAWGWMVRILEWFIFALPSCFKGILVGLGG